ncbi:MAG: hypothetical protein IJ249_04250 [Paludibacteraceae bacterium]|nr:hypothetical protein [Paludibacteraceae bacterium]
MKKLYQFIFDYLRKRMPARNPRFPHLDQPLKVMIIYESDVLERNDAIKSIRQDLLKRQMDVTMWGYVAKKEITTLILPQSRILGIMDYNWWGKPTSAVLTDLQAEHYDLMIDLTTRQLLPLRYLVLYTDADFKVGLNLGEGLHDMLISLPDLTPEQGEEVQTEASWLYNQIMQYLTTIKSND